jgi:8-oxo-dGTP diphosphatase
VIRTYPQAPLVGVAAVVFRTDGRVLLVRRARAPRRGEWSLPGGLQKLGETVAVAACREVAEETGASVRILGLADVVDLIERDPEGGRVRYHYTLIDLVACWQQGALRAGSDAAEAVWADVAALGDYRLWSETTRIIALARDKWLAAGAP